MSFGYSCIDVPGFSLTDCGRNEMQKLSLKTDTQSPVKISFFQNRLALERLRFTRLKKYRVYIPVEHLEGMMLQRKKGTVEEGDGSTRRQWVQKQQGAPGSIQPHSWQSSGLWTANMGSGLHFIKSPSKHKENSQSLMDVKKDYPYCNLSTTN